MSMYMLKIRDKLSEICLEIWPLPTNSLKKIGAAVPVGTVRSYLVPGWPQSNNLQMKNDLHSYQYSLVTFIRHRMLFSVMSVLHSQGVTSHFYVVFNFQEYFISTYSCCSSSVSGLCNYKCFEKLLYFRTHKRWRKIWAKTLCFCTVALFCLC